MKPDRTALIVGAGIGGLAAGLSLRQAGWDVRLFERAPSLRETGFALLLAPNAMRALRALGVADSVERGGVVATAGEIRRANGDLLRRHDLTWMRERIGEPTVVALRPVVHGALAAALGADVVTVGAPVASFAADPDGVEIALEDGRRVRGRVLIGADGVGSTVRRQLHPAEPPPAPSGLAALRGVAAGVSRMPGGASAIQYFGRGIEAGAARASDTAVYWYLSLRADRVGGSAHAPMVVLERAVAGFHQPFRTIAMATGSADMRLDELLERPPIDAWGSGAATLLGDAAHPMLPHAGQGAAQALEDAVALGRALADESADAVGALRRYERVRARRTREFVRLSRRNAWLSSIESRAGCWLRDSAIRLAPSSVVLRSLTALNRPPAEGP